MIDFLRGVFSRSPKFHDRLTKLEERRIAERNVFIDLYAGVANRVTELERRTKTLAEALYGNPPTRITPDQLLAFFRAGTSSVLYGDSGVERFTVRGSGADLKLLADRLNAFFGVK